MGSIYSNDDDDVSSLAPSIRSEYSLQSEMPETSQVHPASEPSQTKAYEARREASSSRQQGQESHELDDTAQPQETTPLLHSGPPPTYSDAIAAGARSGDVRDVWRRAIGHGRLDMNAFTQLQQSPTDTEDRNSPLQQDVMSYQRPPASMADPSENVQDSPEHDPSEDEHLLGSRGSRRRRHSHSRHRKHKKHRKLLRKVLKIGLVVVFVIIVMAVVVPLWKAESDVHNVGPAGRILISV